MMAPNARKAGCTRRAKRLRRQQHDQWHYHQRITGQDGAIRSDVVQPIADHALERLDQQVGDRTKGEEQLHQRSDGLSIWGKASAVPRSG